MTRTTDGIRPLMLLAAALAATAPSTASASARYRLDSVRTISAPDVVPADCENPHDEAESFLATDPDDARHLVATWGAGPGRASVTAVSRNGGSTWQSGFVPGMTGCTGGEKDWTIDGWVDVGAGGQAYFTGFSAPDFLTPFDIEVLASGASDGGDSWLRAQTVDEGLHGATGILSRTSVTADPAKRGRAWAVWSRFVTNPALHGVFVSRTDDGGDSWEPPVRVAAPLPGQGLAAWQVAVLSDGSLLAVFGLSDDPVDTISGGAFRADVPVTVQVSRSTDHGETWTAAETIRSLPSYVLGRLAAGPDGAAWFAWAEPGTAARVRLIRIMPRDGQPTEVGAAIDVASTNGEGMGALDLQPAVAVARNGAVAVSWYAGPRPAATRRVAVSADRGASWQEIALDTSFDFDTGGGGRDGPVGAYQGLAALGKRGFGSVHVTGTGAGVDNPTDVRFSRILPD